MCPDDFILAVYAPRLTRERSYTRALPASIVYTIVTSNFGMTRREELNTSQRSRETNASNKLRHGLRFMNNFIPEFGVRLNLASPFSCSSFALFTTTLTVRSIQESTLFQSVPGRLVDVFEPIRTK